MTDEEKLVMNKYAKKRKIGEGGYGNVYLVTDQETKKDYALKIINIKDEHEIKDFENEITIMKYSTNPIILKCIDSQIVDEKKIYIIMEYMKNKSLEDALKKGFSYLDNTARQIILIGVAYGMKYLHNRCIIHRDLKPNNIVLDDNLYPRIIDFGLSKLYDVKNSKEQSKFESTLFYMSYEMINGQPYNAKVDVYSFAIIMYRILTNSEPYTDNIHAYMKKFMSDSKGEYRPIFDPDLEFNERIIELITKCWSNDPNERPCFNDIFELLITKEYYISNDIDEERVNEYIQNITKIDPISQHTEDVLQNLHKIKETNEICIKKMKKELKILKDANDKNIKLTVNNEQLESEITQLKKQNKKFKTENKNLKEENENLKEDNYSLVNENKDLKKDYSEFKLALKDTTINTFNNSTLITQESIISKLDLKCDFFSKIKNLITYFETIKKLKSIKCIEITNCADDILLNDVKNEKQIKILPQAIKII